MVVVVVEVYHLKFSLKLKMKFFIFAIVVV